MTQIHTTPQIKITSIPTGVMEEYERRLAEIRTDGNEVTAWKAGFPTPKDGWCVDDYFARPFELALFKLKMFVQYHGRAPGGKRVIFYFVGKKFGFGEIEPRLIQATTDPVTTFLIWALDQMGLKARVAFATHVTKDGCMDGEIWIETYQTP